jgi:hypothetical protein
MTGPRQQLTAMLTTIAAARASRAVRILAACAILPASAAVAATGTTPANASGATAGRTAGAVATRPATVAPQVKYCGKNKVTVIVDLTHFRHGKIRVGCATSPRTGLAALRKAGFSYAFVPRQPGFICTINHRPKKCNGAPASAYWSYWHARRHGKWSYSKLGAGSYHPKRGWIEGWAFGNGKRPHVSPP